MKKNIVTGILLLLMSVSLSGCDPVGGFLDFFETLFSANVMIIRGIKTISGEGEVLTIQPGTTIKFKEETFVNVGGELLFKDGAKFVCQGTADEPIVFENAGEATGRVTMSETASNESVIEYCIFNESIRIDIENSITIQRNKFMNSIIHLNKYAKPIIQYNTVNSDPNTIFDKWISPGTIISDYSLPLIQYNEVNGCNIGISVMAENIGPVNIKYNNITGTSQWAINSGTLAVVDGNYIEDCNAKTGVDTTGEQINNLGSYANPSTIPIQNAGCSW